MQCDDARDLMELYVLDQLDDESRQQVEMHLENCAECRAIVADYREVTSLLPGALHVAAPHIPPAALKAAVMDAIDHRRTTNPASSSAFEREGVLSTPRIWRLAATAAAVLLIVVLGWNIQLQTTLAHEQRRQQHLTHQTELIFEVVDSNRSSRSFLRPVEGASVPDLDWQPPYGKVFVRDDLPYIVAMGGRLPPPPEGQTYYFWLERGNGTQLIGEMMVNAEGFGSLVYEADVTGPDYVAAFITLQPTDDTSTPANPVVGWHEEQLS